MRQDAPPLPTVGTQPFTGFRTSVADGNGVRDANALEESGQQGAAWSREGGGSGSAGLWDPNFCYLGTLARFGAEVGPIPRPPPGHDTAHKYSIN